jgi:rod shape determining protein RodA
VAAAAGLIAVSLAAISGATRHDVTGDPGFFATRQAIYSVLGIVVAAVLTRVDYGLFAGWRRQIWGLLIAANLAVFVLSASTRGSHRWISLPFFQLQPSELGKVLLALAFAGFAVENARMLEAPRTTLRLLGYAALPAAIVAMQPDLGTALVYMALALMVLVAAGTPTRHLLGIGAVGLAASLVVLAVLPSVGINVLRPYQVQRLTGFISPSSDPGNATYQVNQSLIAIGSGQRLGRGVVGATQTGLDFLPEHHTDFIFAVIGERWGFTGAALVIALYALLLWRAMRLVLIARDGYGSLLAAAIVAILGFQIFVNIGMALGVMPITGVPLPLMSYGGSSVLVTFMCLGLLQSVHLRAADPAVAAVRARVRV